MMKSEGHYVACQWSCSACGQDGTASVFGYIDELRSATAARHQQATRARCVADCLFRAWSEEPASRHAEAPPIDPATSVGAQSSSSSSSTPTETP